MSDAPGKRESPPAIAGARAGSGAPSASRRKLVLGAASALPSVYTLSSGASAAVTSNFACWDKAQEGTAPQRFVGVDDQWYRAQVYDGNYKGATVHCVTSPQSACVDSGSIAKDGSVWVSDSGVRVQAGLGDTINQVSSAPQSYGLVYVDKQGTISTLDPYNQTGLSYCSDSCWTSIMGGRISQLG
jgi:hypothetical protein